MKESAIERMIKEIKEIKEKDLIDPGAPRLEGEEGLGTASFFAKQIYTYWEHLDKRLIVVEKMLLKESSPSLSKERSMLNRKIDLLGSMFWSELDDQYDSWGYATGIRKKFEVVKLSKKSCHGCPRDMDDVLMPPIHITSVLVGVPKGWKQGDKKTSNKKPH